MPREIVEKLNGQQFKGKWPKGLFEHFRSNWPTPFFDLRLL